MKTTLIKAVLVYWVLTASVVAAEQATQGQDTDAVRVPITVATAIARDLEVWERSVGDLESINAPTLAAEVDGRIVALNADVGDLVEAEQLLAQIDPKDFELARDLARADIERLQSLITAQKLKVKRYRELVEKKSANQSELDDAVAQFGATSAELAGARVRLQQAERNIAKARITSPFEGKVDERMISLSEYVKTGSPLFHITTLEHLRAWLPYPESLASMLRIGLPVKLSTPVSPGHDVVATVTEIRPEITRTSRAIQVIVDLDNPGDWQPGASVKGAVRVALREGAVVAPEACIVRRPSGLVVYRVDGDTAEEVPVTTGIRQDGTVEILTGVQPGDRLAQDGAAYLTGGSAIRIQQLDDTGAGR
jgi:RND family efflux transporter MFP subunit